VKQIKIHFVGNFTSNDGVDLIRGLGWDEGTLACTRHCWVWAIYCRLKMRGFPVSFSYGLEPDAINVVHGTIAHQLLQSSDLKDCYIVGIRADFRPFPYGQLEIVQNKHSAGGRRIYMPHFPQPGLLARASDRKGVVNVCFSGRMQNSGIDPDQFSRDLEAMGCHFVFKGEGQWQEMQDVDLLVGIRSLSKEPHHSKPPSKLFNAWLAGIPFIGGYDSAYEQVGTPAENYLRVATYEELLESIKRLKNDPALYQRLVAAGKKAGESYTPDKTTDRWIDFFETQVAPEYAKWVQGNSRLHTLAYVKSIVFGLEQWLRKKMRRKRISSNVK
jgi:hypothetical protein